MQETTRDPIGSEVFKEFNVDGEALIMTLEANIIRFGNRFEEVCKIHIGAFAWQRDRDIREAFDFFRNYAPLFSRSELPKALDCYRRAARQQWTDARTAFWKFMDGYYLQPLTKATFCFREKTQK